MLETPSSVLDCPRNPWSTGLDNHAARQRNRPPDVSPSGFLVPPAVCFRDTSWFPRIDENRAWRPWPEGVGIRESEWIQVGAHGSSITFPKRDVGESLIFCRSGLTFCRSLQKTRLHVEVRHFQRVGDDEVAPRLHH